MIRLQKLAKSYDGGATYAVRTVDLEVEAGELVVLLGESGCGKTTTLKMINRLIEPSAGTIEVEGRNVFKVDPVQLRRRIGYAFQGVGLFPHMTVGENVGVVPRLLGWHWQDTVRRVNELLELVNLPPDQFRDRLPSELSGGQRQRVGLARALAGKPKTMLMDEPFGALDPLTRDLLQEEYLRLHRDLQLTTVMVTHDMTEALLMADRIAAMSGGRIVRVASPHDMLTQPGDPYVEQLMQTPKKQADRLEALMEDASPGKAEAGDGSAS